MSRVAIFVDAGYMFAQGSTALAGSKKPRKDVALNETAIMAELQAVAQTKCPLSSLLRVYWYDGTLGPQLSLGHATLAHMDHLKLRLGFVTGGGQQKGVDSLIVTDLIELSRNHAIEDAVIVSGDEDIRVGVQIAQSFGVRVHLVGITPSRGSQSLQLLRESDTTTEWDASTVAKFLSVNAPVRTAPQAVTAISAVVASVVTATIDGAIAAELDRVATSMTAGLNSSEITALKSYCLTQRGLPREFDGKLLARGRAQISRDLDLDEKRHIRIKFMAIVQSM